MIDAGITEIHDVFCNQWYEIINFKHGGMELAVPFAPPVSLKIKYVKVKLVLLE